MKLSRILSYIGKANKVNHARWKFLCPNHNDKNPSLSLTFIESKNKILIKCFSGCKTEVILRKVGLKMSDLKYVKNDLNSSAKHTYHNSLQHCNVDLLGSAAKETSSFIIQHNAVC